MNARTLAGALAAAVTVIGSHAQAARADCDTAQSASQQHLGAAVVNVAAGGLLQGDTFAPCNVTISPGGAVHWTISPSGGHTVTSDSSAPASFDFTGGGGTFTFSTPGSYFYYCTFHGTSGAPGTGMDGVVYVQGAGITPPPPPPAFAGVKLVSRKIRVTRKRIVPVRVKCPAATAGSCGGALLLVDAKRRSLSIKPGATKTIDLRLSGAEFRTLVRHRKLRLRLAFDVHDGNGTAANQHRTTLTLEAPS